MEILPSDQTGPVINNTIKLNDNDLVQLDPPGPLPQQQQQQSSSQFSFHSQEQQQQQSSSQFSIHSQQRHSQDGEVGTDMEDLAETSTTTPNPPQRPLTMATKRRSFERNLDDVQIPRRVSSNGNNNNNTQLVQQPIIEHINKKQRPNH